MPNALDPNRMTAAERLDELAAILAAGILRLRTRNHKTRNDPNRLRAFGLDFSGAESVSGFEPDDHGEGR